MKRDQTAPTFHRDGRVTIQRNAKREGVFVHIELRPDEVAEIRAAALDCLAERDEALERVRTLHVPWYEVSGVRHEQRVVVGRDDAPEGHVCVIGGGFDVCEPDETHAVLACSECRVAVPDYEYGLSFWPCPTVRAAVLDGQEGL